MEWVPVIKLQGLETDDSPVTSAEVKNKQSYTSTSPYALMARRVIKKRDNFSL